jgi:hypothetical protein
VDSVLVNTSSAAANIIAFRDLLHSKFPAAHAAPRPAAEPPRTGIQCLDGIGLAQGTITEIVGEREGCGAGLLIAALLQRETTVREPTALVDGRDVFDPTSVPPDALDHLLWVRCRKVAKAMRVTDLLLRDGNLPLVILDLQAQPPREVEGVPASSWHRLRVLAEKSGVALCAFTPCKTVPCARARLVLEHRFALEALEQVRADLVEGLRARVVRAAPAFTASNVELLPALAG